MSPKKLNNLTTDEKLEVVSTMIIILREAAVASVSLGLSPGEFARLATQFHDSAYNDLMTLSVVSEEAGKRDLSTGVNSESPDVH